MEVFFYISLFIFGILFGSFGSVIIYRLKSGESGILNGRSHCAKCNHILGFYELIPIISWIKNLGKCRYCKEKISSIYLFLELSTGIVFCLIGYFLIDFSLIISLETNEIIKLFFWLIIGFITILYSYYDILFLEIHDGIMLTGIILAVFFIILESFGYINIFSYLNYSNENIVQNIIGIGILIFSILMYYIIIFKELELKYDFGILFIILITNYLFLNSFGLNIQDNLAINVSIGILIIFSFLFIQIAISGGAWMGSGDLRIAILLGLMVGYTFSIETLFLTYIIGSIISIFIVLYGKLKVGFKEKINTMVPFGPFLALGFFGALFLQVPITEIIQIYL